MIIPRHTTSLQYPVGARNINPLDDKWYIALGFMQFHDGIVHPGEDWNLKTGGDNDLGESVFSIADGVIQNVGYLPSFGLSLLLIHRLSPPGTIPDSYMWSFYAHLSKLAPGLYRGLVVKQDQYIGAIGKSGGHEYAHLHFELRKQDILFNAWKPYVDLSKLVFEYYYHPTKFIEDYNHAFFTA